MGSGAGAHTIKTKTPTKNSSETQIEEKYGIKPEKLYQINGGLYCNLEREEFKLSPEILRGVDQYNNFSRDLDEEPQQQVNFKQQQTKIK
jgi:hypothetical protein